MGFNGDFMGFRDSNGDVIYFSISFDAAEKYEFVKWEYEIPNWMESHKIPWFHTTNQLCSSKMLL